ncbi:MAG TPA: DUF3572 domain-containing protein [Pseudolabrys sp.]|nr:DUF3572 domain-containing protein [Pseudolabrys sp.]
MKDRDSTAREAAETVAIQALSFIAGDAERLGRFLTVTGIGPAEIRSAAREPEFLAGVLDYLAHDEHLLTEFARQTDHDPITVSQARVVLGGGDWEREVP